MRLFGIILMFLSAVAQGADVNVTAPSSSPAVFARAEWSIDPGARYDNPFDPNEVAIDAHFSGPDGKSIVLPAYWSQKFTDNDFGHHETKTAKADGGGFWLARFAPTAVGRWTLKVVVKDRSGTRESETSSFDVAASKARGFVRRVPDNHRYLAFDSGAAFFPVGLNIAWPSNDGGVAECDKWFGKLSGAGGNFCRIWMTHPNRMTETKDAGIGRFDLAAMAYYDAVFDLAEKHGITFMVCFNNHRDLLVRDQYGEAIWGRFPYNADNGGPATRPSDFVTNREAREFYKRRLRYLIARYSAYTNLAFWEFFNEQEFTRVDVSTDWNREMSEYLHANDPYQHLVTTSAKVPPGTYELPTIDVTQSHLYVGGSADLVGPVVNSARQHRKYNKPHFVSELGIGNGRDEDHDVAGVGTAIHNGIWASALSGCAGSSHHWWWDTFVDPKNVWHVYTGLSKFAAAVDWPRRQFEPVELPVPQINDSSAEQFFDLALACSENWGYVVEGDVIVRPNGTMSQALPHYFVGPEKKDLHRPVRLKIKLDRPTTMVLNVAGVSDVGVLRVWLGDEPLADFPFSALPTFAGADSAKIRPLPTELGEMKRYQATLKTQRTLELPAGEHTVTVATAAGDWVSLESIVFKDAQSSRNQLATLSLQDSSAGETIAWIYDVRSHWQADRDKTPLRRFESTSVTIPVTSGGDYSIEWWDTRTGQIVEKQTASAADGAIRLRAPAFSRDIALRVTINGGPR
jgi:hypothetical protein